MWTHAEAGYKVLHDQNVGRDRMTNMGATIRCQKSNGSHGSLAGMLDARHHEQG
jgi:hypothetical protein